MAIQEALLALYQVVTNSKKPTQIEIASLRLGFIGLPDSPGKQCATNLIPEIEKLPEEKSSSPLSLLTASAPTIAHLLIAANTHARYHFIAFLITSAHYKAVSANEIFQLLLKTENTTPLLGKNDSLFQQMIKPEPNQHAHLVDLIEKLSECYEGYTQTHYNYLAAFQKQSSDARFVIRSYHALLTKYPRFLSRLIREPGFNAEHISVDTLYQIMCIPKHPSAIYDYFKKRKAELLNFIHTEYPEMNTDTQDPSTPLGQYIHHTAHTSIANTPFNHVKNWTQTTAEIKEPSTTILEIKKHIYLFLLKVPHKPVQPFVARMRLQLKSLEQTVKTQDEYLDLLTAIETVATNTSQNLLIELSKEPETREKLWDFLGDTFTFFMPLYPFALGVIKSLFTTYDSYYAITRDLKRLADIFGYLVKHHGQHANIMLHTLEAFQTRPEHTPGFIVCQAIHPENFSVIMNALITLFQQGHPTLVYGILYAPSENKNVKFIGNIIAENQSEPAILQYFSLLTQCIGPHISPATAFTLLTLKEYEGDSIISTIAKRAALPKAQLQLIILLELLLKKSKKKSSNNIISIELLDHPEEKESALYTEDLAQFFLKNPDFTQNLLLQDSTVVLRYIQLLKNLMLSGALTAESIFAIFSAKLVKYHFTDNAKQETHFKTNTIVLEFLLSLTLQLPNESIHDFFHPTHHLTFLAQCSAKNKSANPAVIHLTVLHALLDSNKITALSLVNHVTAIDTDQNTVGSLLAQRTNDNSEAMPLYLSLLEKIIDEVDPQQIVTLLDNRDTLHRRNIIVDIAKHHGRTALAAFIDLILALHLASDKLGETYLRETFNLFLTEYIKHPRPQEMLCVSLLNLAQYPSLVPAVIQWPGVTANMIAIAHLFEYLDNLPPALDNSTLFHAFLSRQSDMLTYMKEHQAEKLAACVLDPSQSLAKFLHARPLQNWTNYLWQPVIDESYIRELDVVSRNIQKDAKDEPSNGYQPLPQQ